MVMLAWPMMYCNALGFIGFLQRAWHPAVRSGPGKAAKNSRPVPPSEEIGISGQLRPQYCGGCFRDGQDRLRPGPRHGTPAGNCYLCDWRCPAALEPFQVAEGLSRSALSLISALLFAKVAEQALYTAVRPVQKPAGWDLPASMKQILFPPPYGGRLTPCTRILLLAA